MRGKWIMYVDQYGNAISASSVRELCRRAGYARGGAKLMYCDKKVPLENAGHVIRHKRPCMHNGR
jgi:hypothetical protein